MLPVGGLKIGTSTKGRLVEVGQYVRKLDRTKDVVFSVGAVSHGNPGMENDYVDESICISRFGLSASVALGKICGAFEREWDIEGL